MPWYNLHIAALYGNMFNLNTKVSSIFAISVRNNYTQFNPTQHIQSKHFTLQGNLYQLIFNLYMKESSTLVLLAKERKFYCTLAAIYINNFQYYFVLLAIFPDKQWPYSQKT